MNLLGSICLCSLFLTAVSPSFGDSEASEPTGPLLYTLAYSVKQLQRYETMSVSPDGQSIAYGVSLPADHKPASAADFPTRSTRAQLMVTEMATGTTRAVGPATGNSWRASWSPDSSQLAFFCDADGSPQLWVYSRQAGTARKVSAAMLTPSPWMGDDPPLWMGDRAAWSPNGQSVYVRLRPATAVKPTGSLPQQHRLPAIEVDVAGAEERDGPAKTPAPVGDFFAAQRAALAEVQVASGKVRVVAPEDAVPAPGIQRLSPSGRWLSYLSAFRAAPMGQHQTLYDLAVVAVSGGKPQIVAANLIVPLDENGGTYRWHPDQDRLVYLQKGQLWLVDFRAGALPTPQPLAPELTDLAAAPLAFTRDGNYVLVGTHPVRRSDTYEPKATGLVLVPLAGGAPIRIPSVEHAAFVRVLMANDRVAWQPLPGALTTQWRDERTGETLVARTDTGTGRSVILKRGIASNEFLGSGSDHQGIVAIVEDFHTPQDLYLFDNDFLHSRRLSQVEPHRTAISVGSMTILETPVAHFDGKIAPVKMALVLPAGAKRGDNLPTLVCIYGGGDLTQLGERFGGGKPGSIPTALFTTRGYAVLLVDTPLGPEGKAGNPLREMTDVLLPQVQHACELGYCDIHRLGLMGHSFGGYGAAGVVTQTHLFRAAIAISGVYDLPASYGRANPQGLPFFSWYEGGQLRMGATPWQDLQRYLANSPYYLADRIETPLLLIHGENDDTLPVDDARRMLLACKRLGKTAQLAVYPGEGHSISYWSTDDAIDVSERIVTFLDRYVRGTPALPKP